MKKHIRSVVNLILIVAVVMSLWGCNASDSKKENPSGISVYYVDKNGQKLQSENYNPDSNDSQKIITELLEKLQTEGTNASNESAVPEEVVIKGFNLTDGIVTIDFSENYMEIENQREVLCRAAVVLTICQVESVECVAFTINDYPYRKGEGPYIGAMKSEDFVSDLGGGNNKFAKADFVLYFANKDGSKLKSYVLSDAQYGEKSKERFIIEQLIKGPDKKGYTATLSTELEVISIVTVNNICYVDFEENFMTEQSKVANKLVIYSIVNSLMELTDIHKVQISVNGDSALEYHNDISLTEPFIRNLDVIE